MTPDGRLATHRNNKLFAFDEVRDALRAHTQYDRGLTEVPIDKIVGSVGRYHDFDRAFLPRQTKTRERWQNIDLASYAEVSLPPVELYQVGEVYFVKDGTHRVSVARQRGLEFIDAYVIEVLAPVPIASADALEALLQNVLPLACSLLCSFLSTL